MVTLIDGREVPSDSEDFRHETEARAIINMPSLEQRRQYLYGRRGITGNMEGGLRQKRGDEAVKRLEQTIKAIWYSNR